MARNSFEKRNEFPHLRLVVNNDVLSKVWTKREFMKALSRWSPSIIVMAQGLDLHGIDLSNKTIAIDFNEADISGANLSWARLKGSCLRRVNLRGANLRGTNLDGVDFIGANLNGADMTGTILSYVKTHANGANVYDCIFKPIVIDENGMKMPENKMPEGKTIEQYFGFVHRPTPSQRLREMRGRFGDTLMTLLGRS